GEPGPAVALEAEKSALTIVGTRGRSVTAGLLLGSVARYLLRSVSRPVLAVHSPLPEVRRVVVGVDASPRSVSVVTAARALADATGARLVLVHVVGTDPNVARSPEAFGVPANVWADAVTAHAEDVFEPLRALAGEADERVEYGVAAERLRAVAKAERAEVVAVGRIGSSGRDVDHWFSVAFSLAVQGPFATLVV
ncbi:MAG: universal stress protein, partial [Myxococcota bacterium]